MARRKNTDNNETRQKILDAGFDLFTQYGFEGTTTRMIAQKADVPLSSISFYFGTKQALYESIVESIFHNVSTVFDDIYTELQAFLEEPVESSDRAERAWDYIRL